MNSAAFAASDYGMRTPRVLSIDDSELMHRLLRARLQLEQVELHSSTSGEEGLRMALALTLALERAPRSARRPGRLGRR